MWQLLLDIRSSFQRELKSSFRVFGRWAVRASFTILQEPLEFCPACEANKLHKVKYP